MKVEDPEVGEITSGGSPNLTCKRDHIKMREIVQVVKRPRLCKF